MNPERIEDMCILRNSWLNKSKSLAIVGAMAGGLLPACLGMSHILENQQETRSQLSSTESYLQAEPKEEKKMVSKDVLGYKMEMLDGTKQNLETYRGSVVLKHSTASIRRMGWSSSDSLQMTLVLKSRARTKRSRSSALEHTM